MNYYNYLLLQKMFSYKYLDISINDLTLLEQDDLFGYLIRNKLISEKALANFYSDITNYPVYDGSLIGMSIYKDINYDFMIENELLIFEDNFKLKLLLVDPLKNISYDSYFINTSLPYQINIIDQTSFNFIKKQYEKKVEDYKIILEEDTSLLLEENVNLNYEIDNAPLVKLVNNIIEKAIIYQASDIHFEPLTENGQIRIRVDGKLIKIEEINKRIFLEIITRIKVMANLDITKKNPQDGKIAYQFNNLAYDLRISTIYTYLGEKIVIRILDHSKLPCNLSLLNYTKEEEKQINDLLKLNHGVIIISGPTGCGKSTTLYTFLSLLPIEENNVVTIEDPVEYRIEGINQIQINNLAGITFSNSLRNVLRQDPNIIMVGEIRDEETAQMSMSAAISGHLVFTTIHANNATNAISRLLDMKIPTYLISAGIEVIISQKLIRRLCPYCKIIHHLTEDEAIKYGLPLQDIYEKKGCDKCHQTGYLGRILLSEFLIIDEQIKKMINEKKSEKEIEKYALKKKYMKISEKWKVEILKGETSLEEEIN